jgi:hypothetical protein
MVLPPQRRCPLQRGTLSDPRTAPRGYGATRVLLAQFEDAPCEEGADEGKQSGAHEDRQTPYAPITASQRLGHRTISPSPAARARNRPHQHPFERNAREPWPDGLTDRKLSIRLPLRVLGGQPSRPNGISDRRLRRARIGRRRFDPRRKWQALPCQASGCVRNSGSPTAKWSLGSRCRQSRPRGAKSRDLARTGACRKE